MYENEIALGVQLLNDKFKSDKWRKEINKKDLDMACGGLCVLGQLFGGYHLGLDALFGHVDDMRELHHKAVAAGFQIPLMTSEDDADIWTKEWRAELKKR